jgi:hypothetical protein
MMPPILTRNANSLHFQGLRIHPLVASPLQYMHIANQTGSEDKAVDLTVWIPLTVGLGLLTMALILAFAEACDRI